MSVLGMAVAVTLVAAYPGAHRRADRYRRAPVCGDAHRSECLVVVPATVTKLEHRDRRRGDDWFATFRVGERDTTRVEVESGHDWRRLHEGRTVTVSLWDGALSRIDPGDDDDPIETTDSPLRAESATFLFGPVVGAASVFGLVTAFRLRARSGSWREKAALVSSSRVRPLGCGVVVAGASACLVFAAGVFDTVAIAIFALVGLVVGVAMGLVLRWWKARRSG